MMELTFVLVVLTKIAVGFRCAMRLTSDNPALIRWIILAPALTGFYVLIEMTQGGYVPYWGDVYRTLAIIPIYGFVGALLSGRNWLDIRATPSAEQEPANADKSGAKPPAKSSKVK
jgi:hypothetical protein